MTRETAHEVLAGKTSSRWSFIEDLRTRLVIAIVLVACSASVLGLVLNLGNDTDRIRQATVETNLVRLKALSIDFVRAISGKSAGHLVELDNRLKSFTDIRKLHLHSNTGEHVYSYERDPADTADVHDMLGVHDATSITYHSDHLLLHHTVTYNGSRQGWVTIMVDTLALQDQLEEYSVTVLMIVAGTAFTALVLALLVGQYFTGPIRKLAAFTREVGHSRDFDQRVTTHEGGEVGDLYDGINSMLREISSAQREIQRISENRMRSIIDTSLDGAVTLDQDGLVTYWGLENIRIFGWKEEEILGRSLMQVIIAPRFRREQIDGISFFLGHGNHTLRNQRVQLVGLHRDGHEIPIEISFTARRESQGWAIHAFIRDLTELREAENELRDAQVQLLSKERLAAVGQLTATVAHELRNPMGTISNSLYTLGTKLDKEDARISQLLARIVRNVDRCNVIISELLDFARDREIRLHPVTVNEWLQRLLEHYECPGEVELELRSGDAIRARIDAVYFESAVINLLDNAVDAAREKHPQGGGRIEVAVVSSGGRVAVVVSDNGPGIAHKDHERVLEPLYSTKVYGVGLGLPTVKKIVEKHGGEIVLEANSRGGVSVYLWLPAGAPAPSAAVSGAAS